MSLYQKTFFIYNYIILSHQGRGHNTFKHKKKKPNLTFKYKTQYTNICFVEFI